MGDTPLTEEIISKCKDNINIGRFKVAFPLVIIWPVMGKTDATELN